MLEPTEAIFCAKMIDLFFRIRKTSYTIFLDSIYTVK